VGDKMSYLDNWLTVINHIDEDDTYKALWGRAIIECIDESLTQKQHDEIVLLEYDIVKKMIKYYWNLYVYYGLDHQENKQVLSRVNKIKELFFEQQLKTQKVWYNEVDDFFQLYPQLQEQIIKQFMTLTNKRYAHQFLHIKKDKVALYTLDTSQKLIRFSKSQITTIKYYKETLINLINYRLGIVLSNYHKMPNILKKVILSSRNKRKKYNLKRPLKMLVRYYHLKGVKDFYTDEPLSVQEATLQPVFPYWFLESNEIWNMVTVSKSSIKQHRLITPKVIQKLKIRNEEVLNMIEKTNITYKKELLFAKQHHLIDSYNGDYKGVLNDL
jgi:hypothetical protein